MCGILGIKFNIKNNETLSICKKLIEELKIRGTHSFGICFYDGETYKLHKTFELNVNLFMNIIKKSKSKKFIFHNRYSTSGDWKNMENNQPIVIDNVGSIAMNGVLTMKRKKEYEKEYNVKCKTDNDAEIFLQKMKQGKNILNFLKQEKDCSFAGVIIKGNKLIGLRNNKRPLYLYKDKDLEFIVSTLDTIKRSMNKIKNTKIIKPYEMIKI